jgi:hypothetical protein
VIWHSWSNWFGDIHQPLHAATDADRGGNCIAVESHPYARNLHAAWDTAVVYALENSVDSGNPDATANKLEWLHASRKDSDSWKSAGGTADIAWESNQVARSQIYQALRIPVEICKPEDNSYMNAPGGPLGSRRQLHEQGGHDCRGATQPKPDSGWPVF